MPYHVRVLFFALALLLFCTVRVSADALYTATASAAVCGSLNGTVCYQGGGSLPGQTMAAEGLSLQDLAGPGAPVAVGIAGVGFNSFLQITASAQVNSGLIGPTPPANVGASATAEWDDTIRLIDPSVSIFLNEQIPVTLTANVFPTLSLDTPANIFGLAQLSYSVSIMPTFVTPGINYGGGVVSCTETIDASQPTPRTIMVTGSCTPLNTFVINGAFYSLSAVLGAAVNIGGFGGSGMAADPAGLSLVPGQSGIEVISAAGKSYAPQPATTPEPSSLLLLGSGLVCLGTRGRKLLRRV